MFVVGDMNPYQAEAKSAEFFSCGFLQHTSIFVAESLVDEVKIGLNYEAQLSDTKFSYPAYPTLLNRAFPLVKGSFIEVKVPKN